MTVQDLNERMARRRRRRRRQAGMTLVEIMIVVIIMALIATGVAVAVMPQWEKANIRQTSTDAQNLKSAAQLYLMDHNECPKDAEELRGEYLDDSKRAADAWDNDFKIECEGSNIYVISSGPDEQFGTEDDIQ